MMTNSLTEALDDLRQALASGSDLDEAVNEIAADYELKPVFLKNRALATFGDLSTLADRVAEKVKVDSALAAESKRQLTIAKLELKLRNREWKSEAEMVDLIEACNRLHGRQKWFIKTRRAPSRSRWSHLSDDQIIDILNRFLKGSF